MAVSKPVSNNFQVSHTIEMSDKPKYLFGATYVGEPIIPDAPEVRFLLSLYGLDEMRLVLLHYIVRSRIREVDMMTSFRSTAFYAR